MTDAKVEHSAKRRKVVDNSLSEATVAYATNPSFFTRLLSTKVEDFVNDTKTVFVASRTDKVVDVWRGLVQHNFLSVPVLQKTESKYYGFIDLPDIVSYLVKHFGGESEVRTEGFWSAVAEEKAFGEKKVNDLMQYPLTRRNPFHAVVQGYSLLHAMELLAKEPALHRVPIISGYPERQLLNLITQSQVVHFLQQHRDDIGDKLNKPIAECKQLFKDVVTVDQDTTAVDAFELMVKKGISGVGVTDSEGVLQGNLSLRDLKLVGYDLRLFWRLYQTVKNFSLKLDHEYHAKHNRARCAVFVKSEDTLGRVLELLDEFHVHRLFIVDHIGKPIGVASLKDLLFEILN